MLPVVAGARPVFFVRAQAPNPRRSCRVKIKVSDIKLAINQAQNICFGYENDPACKVAWDRVEELSSALARQREREILEEICEEDPLACREYDL